MLSNVEPIVRNAFRRGYTNFFEIGCRDGDDANYVTEHLGIKNVYCFEPNPRLFSEIKLKYPSFNVYPFAISDYDGEASFNAIRGDYGLDIQGVSSLKKRTDDLYEGKIDVITVPVLKFSSFIEQNNISHIDLVKIDVEGLTLEVLQGFGKYLNKTKMIHLEAEHHQYWEGQYLYKDIKQFLRSNFIEIYDSGVSSLNQSDHIWINKNS
jgi:FkbM family methyltransferase